MRGELMNVLNRITDLYHESLLTNPKAQAQLSRLGIKPELISTFKLGYADGRIFEALPESGEIINELQELGILTVKKEEVFFGCITFPLYDINNNVSGLIGLKPNSKKVYALPKNQGVFNRHASSSSDEIILVESIIESILLYQLGFSQAIPILGLEPSSDLLDFIRSIHPKTVYLCHPEPQRIIESFQGLNLTVALMDVPNNKTLTQYLKSNPSHDQVTAILSNSKLIDPTHPSGYTIQETELGLQIACENREYRIKGIPLHSLERLRVNIKATMNSKCHIDTLDLYQNKSRRYFITQVSKLFGVEAEIINNDLLFIIAQIESYQAKHSKPEEVKKTYSMTPREEEEAIQLLQDPELLEKILADMETLGHVGEETNKILAYLISVSRKLPRPLSGIIISGSGAGKSGLVEIVQELTPPEDVEFFSRITPQALYYMDRKALKRKLLIIEERAGGIEADYSIRTLQSRQRLSQAVPIRDPSSGKMRTVTFEVEGPIAFLETTTSPEINHENATRCFEIYLDESIHQTQRIHQAQREAKTEHGLIRKAQIDGIRQRHHNLQRALMPVMVEIPYAPYLDFPCDSLRTRRDHERFLSLIEAVTFLFQYQREQKEMVTPDGEKVIWVMSTLEDYTRAYELAQEILGLTLDDLKKYSRDLLGFIKELVEQKQRQTGEETFTRRELREFTGWPDYKIKTHIKLLEDMEYLVIRKVRDRGQYEYQLQDVGDKRPLKGLLTPAELERRITLKKTS